MPETQVKDKLVTVEELGVVYDNSIAKDIPYTFTSNYTGNEVIPLYNAATDENYSTSINVLLSQAGGGGSSQGALVNYVKTVSLSAGSSSQSFNDANITGDMVVLEAVIANPAAQGSDWSVTTADGTVTISGTVSAATNVTLYFGVGVTEAPSIMTNLGSTSADNILKTAPRPGVMGVLGVPNGGTGATSPAAARTNLEITPANIGAAADSAAIQYREWYPNGQSMLSLTPGYYRTSPNNLPSETFPNGISTYGTLCVDNAGYTHITYISVLGDFMIWKSNQTAQWYVVQRQGSVPVSSGGTGARTQRGLQAAVLNYDADNSSINSYPTQAGFYHVTSLFNGMPTDANPYGVLMICGAGGYYMHIYSDAVGHVYIAHKGSTGAPETWRKVTTTNVAPIS